MRTYMYNGVRFRAHDVGCADCFKQDRKLGLFYGSFRDQDTGEISGWEETSMELDFCAYCGVSSNPELEG